MGERFAILRFQSKLRTFPKVYLAIHISTCIELVNCQLKVNYEYLDFTIKLSPIEAYPLASYMGIVCYTFLHCHICYFYSQDGGILNNNPSAIALHEVQRLWGNSVPIQCIISLGTGRYPRGQLDIGNNNCTGNNINISWKDKLLNVIASATDTEGKVVLA